MLELFTIKAMASYSGSNNLWDKLKYVMTYIADNVTDESYRLIDPGNSNNNVLSSIDMNKRSMLSTTMRTIINAIDNDSNSVAIYFPINAKYQNRKQIRIQIRIIWAFISANKSKIRRVNED